MNKFVEAIVMILALLASIAVIGAILNVTQIILYALEPIIIILGIGFIGIIVLSILYPYIIIAIRIIGIAAILLYILVVIGGSFYLMWLLIQYCTELIIPILEISWFNNNGLNDNIDFIIIFFPFLLLFADYVFYPMMGFLLSPVFNTKENNISGEKEV